MASLGLRRLLERLVAGSQEPAPLPPGPQRPDPLEESNSIVVVVLDSCRYDAFVQAAPRWAPVLGPLERRHSYATWTAPSHHNLLMGLLPHESPTQTFASDVYRNEFQRWGERLGVGDLPTKELLPGLWMPDLLRNHLGYRTTALVSMPVLHPATPIARGFDTWQLMPSHNDMSSIVDGLRFYEERPVFALLNVGETHYPYAPTGAESDDLPHLQGLRGTVRDLDQRLRNGQGVSAAEAADFFDDALLADLQLRQVQALSSLDQLFEELFDRVPPGTWITVTADHGELFGEEGYFGHGPFAHPKLLEVPFLEGRVR